MYPKSRIFNELSSSEISVWTKLNPGISPSQWAELCRFIGNLSPKEFTAVVALINAHKCLKNAVKRHVEGIVGIGEGQGNSSTSQGNGQKTPIVSIGPSGVGGEFQREI